MESVAKDSSMKHCLKELDSAQARHLLTFLFAQAPGVIEHRHNPPPRPNDKRILLQCGGAA